MVCYVKTIIRKAEESVMLQKQHLDGERVFVIPGFMSPDECVQQITLSENAGFEDAPITTAAGFVMRKDVRDNVRVMRDDFDLAALLYQRLLPFLPATTQTTMHPWHVCGLNERFRIYRYDIGQQFKLHMDGSFRRSKTEESFYTFMVYLNDDLKGGATNFYDGQARLRLSVVPEQGKALVFWHPLLHEGSPVTAGRKYVLRSDVMYRRS
jgi:hypothetical protein